MRFPRTARIKSEAPAAVSILLPTTIGARNSVIVDHAVSTHSSE
jgi:hypothetical protein